MQPSQPLPLSQIGKLKSAASSSNPQGGIPVTTSAPSSRPGTAEERRKELHKTLRDRHTPQHRLHFFGRPGSSGTTRPHQSGTSGGAESPDVGLEGPTWSNASLVNTQSLAARVEETDNVQLSPSQRHMSKQMRALADRTAKAEAEVATQEHMQQLFAGLPWWRRIVVDENFRRRVATLAARAIRAQEGYHRPDADAQNISLPPMFRWEAMSAENRVVQPTPGASCGPLDGVTHRWKGPFPPNGFVQLTPNVLNLRATAEKKGPLHINVYVPMRPKRQHHHASDQEDFDGTHALDELGGVRGDGMEHRTIGQMILDYEDAQRRKFELEMEAKRQQREAALNGGAGGSNGGMGGTRGKLAMDDEGFLTIDGVRLEQRYVGTLRPSFLLLRWRIICNAIHEYGASVSGLGVGRPGFGVAASPGAQQASPILPSSAASMFGGSMPGSAPGTPRRTVKWNHSNNNNNNNSSSPASVVHGVPDALELQQQQSIITSPTTPGASSTPSWLEGLPKFGVPVFAVEARPARNVYDQSTDKRRVEAYPPSKISGAFTSIRREDIPESRRQFLFQAPGCRKAVHRLFQELHQDATGRIHQAAYVEFMLDLLHVFLPTFHAQSNIEVAEDEWLCRGVPEFPDFTIFYRNLFDFPLILCRERNTMTEEQYISVWDLLYEALYGREKLLGWYEVDIKRTQMLMGLPAPTTTSYAVRSSSPSAVLGGSSSVAANADALSWKAHLPSYLCPTSPESAIEVPLRKNADHYALHRVATHIESTHQQVQLSDPARRTFLIHRLASTHLANRTHQEGKSGDLSPAASFRLAAAASAGRRRNRKMEGGVDAEDNDDDDDYLASPLLEGGGDAGVQFPSLALQVKQLADREKKAATSPGARGQRGKLHKTERQREEARRINEMLAIENKASSLNLYEEVYESPEMPRDDIDEILDYCSEISDTDLMDGSGEEEDLDEDEMIRSLDSAGGVPLGPHDAEVAAVAAAKAAAAARRKRSIRTLYHEDRLQRELRAEREAQEALEAKLLQQRRAALQQKQQRLSPPDLSLSGMSGRRRLSSISPTKPAALRRTSLVAQIAGKSKLGINTARSDDGQTQLSLSGRAPSPTSHKDSEIPVTSGGGIGPSGALSTNDAAAAHDPRPKMVLSPEHAQRVRRAERERVRQLALPNGNELVPTLSPSAPTPLVPPVAVPLQYRTFLASHLTGGARTALDASELQLIHTTPQQQKSSATRLPYGGGSQQHQRRPETAMSAHASLSVNPFQRLSRQTKSLIEATPQGGKSRQATTVDGGADWSSAEQADPQLVTEDPNSLGTANGTPHRQKQKQSNGQRSQQEIPRPYGSAGVVDAAHHSQSTPQFRNRHVAAVSSIPRFSSRPASGESFSSTPSSMIGGVQRMLLTPAQSQAHDEKRRELLALLMLDQQQEVIGGGHAPGGELQGLQPPTGVVDDPFEIQSRPSTNHGGRNSTQQHVAQHPNSADQQDMHQSNNECSLRQQQNHDESVVNEGGSFPTDFPKEGLATFGALSFNSSPNGGNNTVPRRPRMPSFVRHNNQTKMRTVLGDLQTSVLASVTTPPSHPISRSGSKTATPVNSDMPSFTAGAAQRGGSASGARRLTNFTTPHQQSSAGTMPPPGGVVPSIRQLPPPSEGEGAPPDGLTMVRHVVAGNPPTTITPLNGFMQRSQNIAVTPIRPPKYRYPKFKGPQGPPEKLYVNGHLVVGQHPTLALVQRLNLGVPLSKEQQARQDQKPSSPTTQKGNAQGPLSPTTTATGNGEDSSSPHALLPNLPLQGLAHASPTTTTTSTPRGASADMVTPRPLGMGVRSPRTVLATELERTVIVVPTGSGRWDANEASQSLRGGRSTSKQRHSPTATTTAARGAAGELSFSLESVLNITEIPI